MLIQAVTDTGMRSDNQDSFWAARILVGVPGGTPVESVDPNGSVPSDISEGVVLCLCDGMGGLDEGARASQTAADYIRRVFEQEGTVDESVVEQAMREANKELLRTSNGGRLGTTCTVVVALDGEYRIFHVGDSRCYKIRNDNTYKVLTKDHTAFRRYHDRGELVRQGGTFYMNGHPVDRSKLRKWSSMLTSCIGVKEKMEIDTYKGTYRPGEIFLVASDGFWHRLADDPRWARDLRRNFMRGEDYFRQLIEKYKSVGEKDNLTVVAVMV